jgi:hypothetical protein
MESRPNLNSNLKHQPRCSAHSKQTGEQCRQPAMQKKTVCRFHGGKSTGPSRKGRRKIAEANTKYGKYSKGLREARRILTEINRHTKRIEQRLENGQHQTDPSMMFPAPDFWGLLSEDYTLCKKLMAATYEILEVYRENHRYGEYIDLPATRTKIALRAIDTLNRLLTLRQKLLERDGFYNSRGYRLLEYVAAKRRKPTGEFNELDFEITRFILFGGLQRALDRQGGTVRSFLDTQLGSTLAFLLGEDWETKLDERLAQMNVEILSRVEVQPGIWEMLSPDQRAVEYDTHLLRGYQLLQETFIRENLNTA